MINPDRIKILKEGKSIKGPVVYWMQRDQRANDNWALIYSQQIAIEYDVPLIVIFNLVPSFLGATIRHYGFMLRGISYVQKELEYNNINFVLLNGSPDETIPDFLSECRASLLVSDFNPLKAVRKWKKYVAEKIDIPFHQVDTHNIVPCLAVSDKQEFAAYTIRPKIHKLLPEFLDEFPSLKKMKAKLSSSERIDWDTIITNLNVDKSVGEVDWLLPGEEAAIKILDTFIENKLSDYPQKRNDPNAEGTSNLSPYLHFGQISAQRVALEIHKRSEYLQSHKAFLEEMIVKSPIRVVWAQPARTNAQREMRSKFFFMCM